MYWRPPRITYKLDKYATAELPLIPNIYFKIYAVLLNVSYVSVKLKIVFLKFDGGAGDLT